MHDRIPDSREHEGSADAFSRRRFLQQCATLAALATTHRAAGEGSPLRPAVAPRAGANRGVVTPPQQHWPRWEALSGYFYDGPILGNALLGAVAHRANRDRFTAHAGAVLFAFNRADLTQPVSPRIPEGADAARFMVGRFALPAAEEPDAVKLELDLARAELRGTVRQAGADITLRAFVHATRPLLVIDQAANGAAEPGEIDFLPAPAGIVVKLGRVDYEETAGYHLHPPARRGKENGITLHEQTVGEGITYTVAWAQWRTGPGQSRFVATLAYSHPVKAAPFSAAAVVQEARAADVAALDTEHRRWWSEHYQRISLSLPDDPVVERFWWLQQYKIGCLMRPELQLLDLNGPWYCHTPWPAIWWNLNTQMMYRHLAAGNRAELAEPMLEILERNVQQLGDNLPETWRAGGALAIGRASSFNLDSPVTMIADEADPTREGREAGNLVWALHSLWWIARHQGVETSWEVRLLPLLRRAVKVYDPLLEQRGEVWHLKETFSPEYKAAPDCHYDLSLLRWACRTLVTLAPADREAPRWRDLAEHLADYPTSPDGTLAVGRGVDFDRGHRHFSHLMAIWPVADWEVSTAEGAEVARRSLEHWLSRGELAGWSHAVAAAMYARLHEAEPARAQLELFLKSLTYCTLYREAGLCLETPFIGLDALHSLIVQSGPEWVHVLPAVPPHWRTLTLAGVRVFGGARVSITAKAEEVVATFEASSPFRARVAGPRGFLRQGTPEILTLAPNEVAECRWVSRRSVEA